MINCQCPDKRAPSRYDVWGTRHEANECPNVGEYTCVKCNRKICNECVAHVQMMNVLALSVKHEPLCLPCAWRRASGE